MSNPIHDAEREEWRSVARELSSAQLAPYDDPQTYNDTMAPDGTRYGER